MVTKHGSVSTTTETLDIHGNLTQAQVTDYGSATRTYNDTYLTGVNYTSKHIYNRLLLSTVTSSGPSQGTEQLVSNWYDAG